MSERPHDEHGRAIFGDREVPDPWSPESRFAQWRGKTCGPWTVITVSERRHHQVCRDGWTNNDRWWYVCGRCHPDAIDKPGRSEHQIRELKVLVSREAAEIVRAMHEDLTAENHRLRALVVDLGQHLEALCDHPRNFENRYLARDGYPCAGCYDARDAFRAWKAEQTA